MADSLYGKIAESLKQKIIQGKLAPGDQLPSIREMAKKWGCTQGVVQQAYRELVRAELVISRPGLGTQVVSHPPLGQSAPMRKATLIHKTDAFLMEALNSGYEPDDICKAFQQSLERWQVIQASPEELDEYTLHFTGSHDLAVASMAISFENISSGWKLVPIFAGSMGGLLALLEGKAQIAGCHLWDEETDTYNEPYIRQIFPNQRMVLLNLALRDLGLILPAGNPLNIRTLQDLLRPEVNFINRQPGSGTRVWLDAQLKISGIEPSRIQGFSNAVPTHSAVAQAIAESHANAGIGLKASAQHYDLEFIRLKQERYDLVMYEHTMNQKPVKDLTSWLRSKKAKFFIASIAGYEPSTTGEYKIIE